MNLTCPSCATTFVVEFQQLGPAGRQVRCGSCGHSWFQAAEKEPAAAAAPASASESESAPFAAPVESAPDAAPVELAAAPPEKPARRRAPRPPPLRLHDRGRSSLLLGWILFLAVVSGLVAGLYFGRAQVIALLPAAANLYRMAGLAPPQSSVTLELRDVRSVRRAVDGEQSVVVEGLVANVSNEPQSVPMLRASLTDAKGAEIETWTFAASATTLPAGGSTGFETVAKNPPSEGRILIDFVATE